MNKKISPLFLLITAFIFYVLGKIIFAHSVIGSLFSISGSIFFLLGFIGGISNTIKRRRESNNKHLDKKDTVLKPDNEKNARLVIMLLSIFILVIIGFLFFNNKNNTHQLTQEGDLIISQQNEINSLKKQIEEIQTIVSQAPQNTVEQQMPQNKKETQSDKLEVSAAFIAERTAMLHCLQIKGTENEIKALYDVPVYEPAFEGSSVVISEKGELLTNAHVVGNAPICLVQTAKSPNYSVPSPSYFARVLSVNNDLDIAKLQIISDIYGNPIKQNLKYFELEKQAIFVGQKIYIAGFSVASNNRLAITDGIISGYNDKSGLVQGTFLITSAKIDSGNSGGAAFTNEGKLVGLPTFLMGNYESLGYIIDLNRTKEYFNF